MKKYDHTHKGELSYGDFCHAMIAQDYTDRSKGAKRGGGSFHSGAEGHKDMTHKEKIKYLQHVKALKVTTDQKRRLNSLLHEFAQVFFAKGKENYARKAFNNFDVDNSGTVDCYEFDCALKAGIGVKGMFYCISLFFQIINFFPSLFSFSDAFFFSLFSFFFFACLFVLFLSTILCHQSMTKILNY